MQKKQIAVVLAAALAGACSTQTVQEVRHEVRTVEQRADSLKGRVGEKAQQGTANVTKREGMWIPTKRIAVEHDLKRTPEILRKEISINRTFFSLNEVAERITLNTGVSVTVSIDAAQNQQGSGAQPVQTPAVPGSGMPALPPLPGQAGPSATASFGVNVAGSPGSITVAYKGSLSGLLDTVAARYNISWDYRNDRIEFFRYQTKTFTVAAVPGEINSSNRINNKSSTTGSGAGGAGGPVATSAGGSTDNALSTAVEVANMSVWKGIDDSVKTMLSPGGRMVVTPSVGTITVTDTPRVIDMVSKYIEQTNAHLSKQVVVNVQVLAVNLNKTEDYGINWDVVYNALSKNFGFAFSTASTAATGTAALTMRILSTAGTATGSGIQSWQGSRAILNALSTQGDVSVVTSATAMTMNNQPVPVQVGKQTAYLASSATTNTSNVGSTTTLTPATITTGFAMNVLPHIQSDGRLLLQYALDMSTLTNLHTVTSGGSSIQTPEVETRNFLQRVSLRSGETLVMAGFEALDATANNSGIGSASNTWAGGAVKADRSKRVIVVLVRPVIMDKI